MNILITTHGNFASGLLDSYKMIAGETESIHTLSLDEHGIERFKNNLTEKLDSLIENGNKVLILCDLKGGSPYNESFLYSLKNIDQVEIVTGVNLPMLIELGYMIETEKDLKKLADIAVSIGLASIERVEDSVDEDMDEDLY